MEHATAQQVVYLAHGTTVSTNALIEKKGAKVGVITTEGFNDIMEIGIQKRPFMYDTLGQKPEPLIMSGMNRGVPGAHRARRQRRHAAGRGGRTKTW